jgi:hypothetical protein
VQARYSLHQLQYLNAIIDTSTAKATHAQSAVIKRQFEKKLKAARVRPCTAWHAEHAACCRWWPWGWP